MGKYRKKKLLTLFWKLQKGEGFYWFLELFAVTIMSLAIYLFLFFLWLYQCFSNVQQGAGELATILEFSQKGLHLLLVACIFIGILTLQSLCFFRSTKNQRRTAILRAFGLQGKWNLIFNSIESVAIVLLSFLPSFLSANLLFLHTAKEVVGTDGIPTMPSGTLVLYVLLVSLFMIGLLIISYQIAGVSESHKSIAEQLRGAERKKRNDEKKERNRLTWFFIGIYFILLIVIAEQMETILIGTVILIMFGLCNFMFAQLGVKLTEQVVATYRKKKRYKAEFVHLALETSGMKNRKNVFLITVMATGLLLFYFLSSIDWGLESFLERSWIQGKQTNVYMAMEYGTEQELEQWLQKQKFSYQKLYMKEWEEENLMLAVSTSEDKNSPYYAEQGHMKTIAYNFYNWGVSEGEIYYLGEKEFLLDKPMNEEGFQLISYTCLINAKDWSDQLDNSYTTAFAMCVDKQMLAKLEVWTKEHKVELMNSPRYMNLIKQMYAPYLNMLKVILLILSLSILLFLFVSILSSMLAREKEFFVYRGCGVSWNRIRNLVLVQYLYRAFAGSVVSALLYCIVFNCFKLIWFKNATTYFVGIKQLLVITVIVFGLTGVECYIAMRFIQKRNKNITLQIRAD